MDFIFLNLLALFISFKIQKSPHQFALSHKCFLSEHQHHTYTLNQLTYFRL